MSGEQGFSGHTLVVTLPCPLAPILKKLCEESRLRSPETKLKANLSFFSPNLGPLCSVSLKVRSVITLGITSQCHGWGLSILFVEGLISIPQAASSTLAPG